MADTNPFTNGMISIRIEDGLAYYILEPGVLLFKATKSSATLDLTPGRLSFFGVYNTDPAYIASYENEYGIIFAFETTSSYKLLALDHPTTKMALYNIAREDIKKILRKNYGYPMSGSRDSELNSDTALSQYLCKEGYEGYAINTMKTDDIGGEFHPEFMICNVEGLRFLRLITNETKIANILARGDLDKVSRDLKLSRKGKQRHESPYAARAQPMSVAPTNLFASTSSPFASYGSPFASSGSPGASYGSPRASYGSPRASYGSPGASYASPGASYSSPGAQSRFETSPTSNVPKISFDMEEDEDDENSPPSNKAGGLRQRKRRSYKKRKTRTNKRKRSIRRKKGTRKRR